MSGLAHLDFIHLINWSYEIDQIIFDYILTQLKLIVPDFIIPNAN